VPINEGLALTLLEANAASQEILVNAALDLASQGADEDPYGTVLWPAAQVVAQALAGLELEGARVLELGAGTGLCSLAAAACGAEVLATDYREEPLELLRDAAVLNKQTLQRELRVSTRLFDLQGDEPLPLIPHVLVAADLLYFKRTSSALARRCIEALAGGARYVLVGDCGRPGQGTFIDELLNAGVREAAVTFRRVDGWSSGSHRHSLIASCDGGIPQPVSVGLLTLEPSDLSGSSPRSG